MKTLISAQPYLANAMNLEQPEDTENSMCFELLGFDIMFDRQLKPWLIEVNHLPSFATDSPLDEKVKSDLILDTFKLLNMSMKRKKKLKREKQQMFI